MKCILEIPPLSELLTSFDLIYQDKNIDGMSLEGDSFITEYWEDTLDYAECDWVSFRNLLPHEIAIQLPNLPAPLQKQLLAYAHQLVKRAISFDLEFISLNLGFDKLAWPEVSDDDEIRDGLARRFDVLNNLMPSIEMGNSKLCLPIRLPIPSIAKRSGEMICQFIKDYDHPQLALSLKVVLDELKNKGPQQVEPYLDLTEVIAFQYIPRLGIKPTETFHENWSTYLKEKNYHGTICFIPSAIDNQDLFNYDLKRLSRNIETYWR